MNTEGGKKRVLKNRKGGDADGGAIELGSILAPAVLYGLRRALDSNKSKGRKVRGGNSDELLMETQETGMDEYTAPQEGGKRRKRRGGAVDAVFVSQPSPLEGGVEEVLSTQLPVAGAVPVLEGGKKRKAKKDTKRGGDKDKSDDDQEGGKKRKAKKAVKRGGDKDQSDDDQEGGKKRKAKKAVKRGGSIFSSQPAPIEADVVRPLPGQLPLLPADGGDLIVPKEAGPVAAEGAGGVLEGGRRKAKKDTKRGGDKDKSDDDQEGGKKRKAKKAAKRGGDKDQSDDDQEGGKKRKAKKAVKRGGDKDQSDDDQEGGKKRKRVVKRGGADDTMMEQYASVDQEGGKRKDKKDDKRGGAIDLFTQQLKEVTDQLNKLMKK